MRRLVVIGGGISGLAAAWAARRAGGVEVLVLERAPQVGGKANSIVRDGWLVEGGPSGYLGGRPELERLIDEVGLSGERVPANS
ncbi:MAG TPA: FAD-dependent oxidoreductase, partial [Gemmatimonadales bacterium]|nr:FAD-dependent oxidoreductase [Gemmatimonadales bacterium]